MKTILVLALLVMVMAPMSVNSYTPSRTAPSYSLLPTNEVASPQDCGMIIAGAVVISTWCATSCMTGIDCSGNVCIMCVQMCLLDEETGAISLEEFTLGDC